jgi:hypothetical protein
VIIGKHRGHVELDAGVAGEEVDRLRPILEESVHALLVEVGSGLVLEVGLRRARRLLDALLGGEPGPRDPQPAAGARGGAAEARLLLDHSTGGVVAPSPRQTFLMPGAHDQHVDCDLL